MRVFLALVSMCAATTVLAANEIDAKVEGALAAEARPQADRDRDRNRRPLATLNFFGLRDNMRVIELVPGGGWYTRVLAPVLAENGKLYVALGTESIEDSVLREAGFDKVEVIARESNLQAVGGGIYTVDAFDFGVRDIDMVLTFRNMHNMGREARDRINSAVFQALKPGGVYGVVDHTRRHMEPDNPENRRRVDPVALIKELLAHGFEFVDYSDLHYRPDDELEYEVGRPSVTGNTDRFTLLFRKP